RIDPKDGDILFGRGIAKLANGDTAGGNADLAAARDANADLDVQAVRYRVQLDQIMVSLPPRSSPQSAVAAPAQSADVPRNRGDALSARGQHDRAIAEYSEAIRINPKDAMAFFSRAYSYTNKKDYDRAITDYGEAIKLTPRDAAAFSNRGEVYSQKGE